MNFKYDPKRIYKPTEDTKDIENYVGCRVPMMSSLVPNHISKEQAESVIVKFLTFGCVFHNCWTIKGADDIRILPVSQGKFNFTALKDGKVMKQTLFVTPF
jgi:hypothetical protein